MELKDLGSAEVASREHVVLCDESGRPTGVADKSGVHHRDTPFHLAFSLHLVGPDGRVLVTRRSLAKVAWPGVWTNSCCGHPALGESNLEAAHRRAGQELGVDVVDVEVVLPEFTYRAEDASGIVEHEFCPVLVGRTHGSHAPDPSEVAETAWVEVEALRTSLTQVPALWSPWFVMQARDERLWQALRRAGAR